MSPEKESFDSFWNAERWSSLLSYLNGDHSAFSAGRIRGMSDTQVYKTTKVDRRLFSKIRSNDTYQPSKKTAIRLCLALKTDLSEALALLEKAGFCLSRSKRDKWVRTMTFL